nr:prepilin-type N-terminal cleavage/methylation domain-containing protein [Endozoicomonas sp.]
MKTRMSEIRKASGFTLIELMIVVAIIGILAAV